MHNTALLKNQSKRFSCENEAKDVEIYVTRGNNWSNWK